MGLFHSLLLLGTKPKNTLEEAFMAFLKERMEPPEFEVVLKAARVVVLVKDAPQAQPESLRPLVLNGADGRPALCVFTHPDRAKPMWKKMPEYAYAMETDFTFVLGITPPGVGMQFNPGTIFSTEVLPEGVDGMRTT